MTKKDMRSVVRDGYAKVAKGGSGCCSTPGCCSGADLAKTVSRKIGYSEEDMAAVPEGANLGLGCGNPVALASLRKGEIVLDLGSGAGFDCFLASKRVGPKGKVLGVDMTPEMLVKARANAERGGYGNVEFRLGEIEALPVADGAVDAVISNCVINLSIDKPRVFREAFRVLRPGGRLMVSDIVLLKPLPKKIMDSAQAYVGCLSGAMKRADYLAAIRKAGFRDVTVVEETEFPMECMANDPTAIAIVKDMNLSRKDVDAAVGAVVSVKVSAEKPK
jgi:SAM-dependent methyltransferase